MNQTMSDDIPQDQVEAVSRAICSARGTFEPDDFNKNSPNGKQWGLYFAQAIAAIRVLTPMVAEQCAEIADAYATAARAYAPEDTEETHVSAARAIAFDIRSVKGAVT